MKNEFQIKKCIEKINLAYDCLKCPSLYSKSILEMKLNNARMALSDIRDDIEREWNEITVTGKLRKNE